MTIVPISIRGLAKAVTINMHFGFAGNLSRKIYNTSELPETLHTA
jgi:hypothetical protein